MRYLTYLPLILGLFPIGCSAETILYACTINGHTILTNALTEKCDIVKEYRYLSYESHDKQADSTLSIQGLRPLELRALEANMKRYEHVDERVGYSLLQGYNDSHQDKCAFYQALYNSAASYIAVKNEQMVEIGPYRTTELMTQLEHAQTQIDYYCKH